MLAFEWVQTGLVTGVAFKIFVYNYGDTESLTKIYYGWFFVAVMCSIVSVTVQLFFAWRIFVLARSLLIAGAITLVRPLSRTTSTHHGTTRRRVLCRSRCCKGRQGLHWGFW